MVAKPRFFKTLAGVLATSALLAGCGSATTGESDTTVAAATPSMAAGPAPAPAAGARAAGLR